MREIAPFARSRRMSGIWGICRNPGPALRAAILTRVPTGMRRPRFVLAGLKSRCLSEC